MVSLRSLFWWQRKPELPGVPTRSLAEAGIVVMDRPEQFIASPPPQNLQVKPWKAPRGFSEKFMAVALILTPWINRADLHQLLGISRARVRQLCEKHGFDFLKGPHVIERLCVSCNEPLPSGHRSLRLHPHCKRTHDEVWQSFVCKVCGKEFERRRSLIAIYRSSPKRHYRADFTPEYCSRECWVLRCGGEVTVLCVQCPELVILNATQSYQFRHGLQQNFYCRAHTRNSVSEDTKVRMQELRDLGLSASEIGRQVGYGTGAVYKYTRKPD